MILMVRLWGLALVPMLLLWTSTPPIVNVSSTSHPLHDMSGCARDAMDAECEHIVDFEAASFPGSSHVTSIGTLTVNFLVYYDHIPMKLENLIGI
jgi:hypothetical protein